MTTHFHKRTGAHPKHSTLLVQESWCGEGGNLATDGRDVDCEACKRAWEGIARPVTNIELAEMLRMVDGMFTINMLPTEVLAETRVLLFSGMKALRERLLAPSRKWPFS